MNQRSITESYRRRYHKYGKDPRSLRWETVKGGAERFKQIVSEINFRGKSILDVGCGFGDIIPYVQQKTKDFKYRGVDIVPEFIEEARKTYPQYNFEVGDFVRSINYKKADVIIASGSLNSNRKNNLLFRKKIIKKMFSKANHVFVFNMLGNHPQPANKRKSNVWYVDSLEILEYCLTISKKVIFKTGYATKDFTILMFKEKLNDRKS